jgi:hypothetical protein
MQNRRLSNDLLNTEIVAYRLQRSYLVLHFNNILSPLFIKELQPKPSDV